MSFGMCLEEAGKFNACEKLLSVLNWTCVTAPVQLVTWICQMYVLKSFDSTLDNKKQQ